jgi:hypothetical protein
MNQPAPAPVAAAGPPMTKAAQKIIQDIDFLPGEAIQYSIQADGYFLGANPLQKLMGTLSAFLVTITGGHIRVFVFVTNQRIVIATSEAKMCGCSRNKAVKAVALAALAEAGWAKETQYCCINTRQVHLETKTERQTLVIKKLKDDALRGFVSQLSAVMVANASGRTAT